MKSNLVKIIATFGLIVVIAIILKSVFGIGNLGIKNLFSKDIYLACKNIEKDEVFTVKLNDKEKLWQEDWGTFNVFEWDKNKIEGYYIMWMETPLSDGTTKKEQISKKLKELGVEDSLANLKGITQGMLVLLGQRNIKKLADFADLSSDELIGGFDEIKGKKIRIEGYLEEFSLSREEADQLIMGARDIVFK